MAHSKNYGDGLLMKVRLASNLASNLASTLRRPCAARTKLKITKDLQCSGVPKSCFDLMYVRFSHNFHSVTCLPVI